MLASASDSADLPTLGRAAAGLGIGLASLAGAQDAGLLTLRAGNVVFNHPLARSAIYAEAPVEQRRDAHRALAAALPDRDVDRRAWHLAAAAVGVDEAASVALEQAGRRGRDRSAYATTTTAFERAARLTGEEERAARLLREGADAAWLAGLGDRAAALLKEAGARTRDERLGVMVDHLAGRIALRRGPPMTGHAILTRAAERADPETAVVMHAEAAGACFVAGAASEMARSAARPSRAAGGCLAERPVPRGHGHRHGTCDRRRRGGRGPGTPRGRRDRPERARSRRRPPAACLAGPGPGVLRERVAGRELIDQALSAARERAAVGALAFLLNLVARDQATSEDWAMAEATYTEAIELASETGQQVELAFGLAGLAWLQARRGREDECRALAARALSLSRALGLGMYEIWATAALGEVELGRGQAAAAGAKLELQEQALERLGITDVDLSPAAELIEAYLRTGRAEAAGERAERMWVAATAKGSRGRWPAPGAAGDWSPRRTGSARRSSRRWCCTRRRATCSRRRGRGWSTASACDEPGGGCGRVSSCAPRWRRSTPSMRARGRTGRGRSSPPRGRPRAGASRPPPTT